MPCVCTSWPEGAFWLTGCLRCSPGVKCLLAAVPLPVHGVLLHRQDLYLRDVSIIPLPLCPICRMSSHYLCPVPPTPPFWPFSPSPWRGTWPSAVPSTSSPARTWPERPSSPSSAGQSLHWPVYHCFSQQGQRWHIGNYNLMMTGMPWWQRQCHRWCIIMNFNWPKSQKY